MAFDIISRKDAKARGLKRYFTGKECKHGHVDQRRINNGVCFTCFSIVQNETRPHRGKLWHDANRERKRELGIKWRLLNAERNRQLQRNWEQANRDKLREKKHKRRARKYASAGSFSATQIEDLLRKQKYKCASCLKPIDKDRHLDHVVSLFRGGANNISNLQWLCVSCNCRKSSKDPIRWANENGRLL